MDSLHHERYAPCPGRVGVERRLAAILAADVVGYTALMGADEAGTLRRLTDLRQEFLEPLIDEHHGRGRPPARTQAHRADDGDECGSATCSRG